MAVHGDRPAASRLVAGHAQAPASGGVPVSGPLVMAAEDLCWIKACVLPAGHMGDHECACGQEWPR